MVDQKRNIISNHLFYQTHAGYGIHEVVIDYPNHSSSLEHLSALQIQFHLKPLKKPIRNYKKSTIHFKQMFIDISYNICFMEGKTKKFASEKNYLWYMQIIPRFSSFAGQELSTETYINLVFPEITAQKIREIL